MRILNDYPEWHKKPIRLTTSEIENPEIVIGQFFECYHLVDIRICLKSWLQDALAKETLESKQHIYTHDWVEKLVEAAWVIHQNNRNNNKSEGEVDSNRRFNDIVERVFKIAGIQSPKC